MYVRIVICKVYKVHACFTFLIFYVHSKFALTFFSNTWLAEYEGEIVIKGDHISDYAWKVTHEYRHVFLKFIFTEIYIYGYLPTIHNFMYEYVLIRVFKACMQYTCTCS